MGCGSGRRHGSSGGGRGGVGSGAYRRPSQRTKWGGARAPAGAHRKCWSLAPLAWVPGAGHSPHERRWACARLRSVAAGISPDPPTQPPSPRQQIALWQSGSARGSAGATGGRELVASACTVMLIGRVAIVWQQGGSRCAGRPAGRRPGPIATFPHAVNRNRAPAHLRSRVEWPAHGTQASRRPKHSTSRWRRQAPSLSPHFVRCDGRRRRPSQRASEPASQRVASQPAAKRGASRTGGAKAARVSAGRSARRRWAAGPAGCRS
jgi:hypothetical protein